MSLTPEYGDEGLMTEREDEIRRAARGPLPLWEKVGEPEVREHEEEEEELAAVGSQP